jgi:hypothetical protein
VEEGGQCVAVSTSCFSVEVPTCQVEQLCHCTVKQPCSKQEHACEATTTFTAAQQGCACLLCVQYMQAYAGDHGT